MFTILKEAMKGMGTCEMPDEILDEIVEETIRDMRRY